MSELNKVTIDLDKYNEFVIFEYEQGKYKESLISQIKLLEERKNELETCLNDKSDLILKRFATSYVSASYLEDREDIENEVGYRYPFSDYDKKTLYTLGFTKDDLKIFVKRRFDEFQLEKDNEEKESNE